MADEEITVKTSYKFLGVLICSLLLSLVSSFAYSQTIKVGILLPLTGKLAKFGEIEKRSFLLALEDINQAGGAQGREIELVFADTKGDPEVGRKAAEKLILQEKVICLGGGYSSSVTWKTAGSAQNHKIPFLINTAAADRITEQGWKYIFRLNQPVSDYPKALSIFLQNATEVKTVSILFEKSVFGRTGSKKFADLCNKVGLEVLSREGYDPETGRFDLLMEKMKKRQPDLVYMISYVHDAIKLMQQARETGVHPHMFVGGAAGFTLPEFYEKAGRMAEYVYSATLWVPSAPYPGAQKYYDDFFARYGEPTEYHGAEAYSAMYVLADALNRAEKLTPEAMRQALSQTDMMTPFGPVKFISYGRKIQQNSLPTFLVQWQHGKLETVWPSELATKKYVYPVPQWDMQ